MSTKQNSGSSKISKPLLFLGLLMIANLSFVKSNTESKIPESNPNFDKALAEKLGADEFGMK